jgi:lipopolysaccharide export system protein LptA
MTWRYTASIPKLFASAMAAAVLSCGPASSQNFGGAFDGMRNSSEPIQIAADRLEVADGKGTAVFQGKVEVIQGSTVLKTSRLFVEYARNSEGGAGPGGNINRIEASGGVAIRSRDQHATAQKAEVDMRTQIATLSGNVSVSQGNNVIEGCLVIMNMKTNNIEVKPCGGRVKVLIDQSSGAGQ